ncbi:hypothetical protein ACE1AT_04750 [Pelatocladus sp. BLCC-F211]|uniref:hypothetical protein n=1 Tax=Pelatocladus sp. BLCC-F211 TaxID=3342752 RepID=UPI0035B9EE05
MTTVAAKSTTLISKTQAKKLLGIDSQDTINSYFKEFNLFEREYVNWDDIRNILKLQMFLGLKPGRFSKQMFHRFTNEEMDTLLLGRGFNVDDRLNAIKAQYYQEHREQVPQF